MIVGITGGIGSGKTTVAKIIEVFGFPVYYSDQRAKELMNENEDLKKQLKIYFGEELYQNDLLDRAKLAAKIFQDKEALFFVNSIVHPAVRADFNSWAKKQTVQPVFQESALLFEIGAQKVMDCTILVTANENTRIERVMKRDKCTRDEVLSRMKSQLVDAEKEKLASFIIQNDAQKLVIPQVLQIIEKLKS